MTVINNRLMTAMNERLMTVMNERLMTVMMNERLSTARRDGLGIKYRVRKAAMAVLAKERIAPNFGNAGSVESLVGRAKQRLA